jgi:apolipoprotein D and lipocalin family protein
MRHEIAHLPLFFQRRCADQITATYTQNFDGSIGVLNVCRTHQGRREASSGVAKRGAGESGALRVTFVPSALRWLPWVWADYWVIELDGTYRWAVVGGPSRRHL